MLTSVRAGPGCPDGSAPTATMDHSLAMTFATGGFAGCISKAAVAPLTRLTALLQTQSLALQTASCGSGRIGAWHLMQEIIHSDGLRGLFRGNVAVLTHRAIQSGSCFVFTGFFKKNWEANHGKRMGAVAGLTASCVGATCAVACTHPLDVVKTRLITERGCESTRYYRNSLQATRLILRDEGFCGLYRGLGVSLVSTAPTIGMSFFMFDKFTAMITGGQRSPTLVEAGLAGGASGAFASTLLFPLDLVKKQMQMMGACGKPQPYCNALDAMRKIYRVGSARHGRLGAVQELYRGLTVELCKVVPAVGIKFYMNELLLKIFRPA